MPIKLLKMPFRKLQNGHSHHLGNLKQAVISEYIYRHNILIGNAFQQE
jgi:hypothetical protein